MKTKKGFPKTNHDSDTDSVSSTSLGVQAPCHLKASGVSPLNRRRSLRIAALTLNRDSTMQDLTRQSTVVMETPKVLERMETSNNFKRWRRQKTMLPQETLIRPKIEDSSDEEMECAPNLLKEQSTSTDLRNALLNTKLQSSVSKRQLKRKATKMIEGPANKKRGAHFVNTSL